MKIVIGLSGGVDSSVAAWLLQQEGHELIGCTMRTFDTEKSLKELADARAVAERLGIPFYVTDCRSLFQKEVIRPFVQEYTCGRTPNACCICNRKVKWEALMGCAREHGAEMVATGHYARVAALTGPEEEPGGAETRYCIRQAKTLGKDQSYALYNLRQDQLRMTRMPLGEYTKEEVRQIAARIGLFTAEKPDSQEICFIPEGNYAAFIEKQVEAGILGDADTGALGAAGTGALTGGLSWDQPGNFVDEAGKVLGRHAGIIHYTVGQRKRLGIALGKRVFVKEIRPLTNEVVLADDDRVFSRKLLCGFVNWQGRDLEKETGRDPSATLSARVKIRYAHEGTMARIRRLPEEESSFLPEGPLTAGLEQTGPCYEVCFAEPVRAVTPGQAAVFYDEEGCILGGGLILPMTGTLS